MAEQKLTQAEIEEQFRNDLADVVAIAGKLAPYCTSITDMVDMCELARSNDGQLRLLISIVTQGKK